MATMRQIRSRIRVAKNIQQITKAMKMVAAARLKRAQDMVQSSRPYAEKMSEVVRSLAGAAAGKVDHPLLEKREIANTGVLVFTADRGLCGSYNSALLRRASELLHEYDPARVRLFVVGRKGNAFLRRRGYNIISSPQVNSNVVSFGDAAEIAREVRTAFEKGDIDELLVLYTRFISPLTQKPTIVRLLPIEPPESENSESGGDYLFEPEPETLLKELLPRYLVNQVYQSLLESVASEHGARMTSMSSATDNAGKMISTLTLSLNRARQASITKEISEIVGGAEALKG